MTQLNRDMSESTRDVENVASVPGGIVGDFYAYQARACHAHSVGVRRMRPLCDNSVSTLGLWLLRETVMLEARSGTPA